MHCYFKANKHPTKIMQSDIQKSEHPPINFHLFSDSLITALRRIKIEMYAIFYLPSAPF